jgi:uncharacterized protein (TIRG00374 family)
VDRKKLLGLALRVGVSAGLLVFLFLRIPSVSLSDLLPDWNRWTLFWVFGGFALTFLALLISVFRWHLTVHTLGLEESGHRLFSHFMAGQFVSNFVPTTIGGDVLRIHRLTRDTLNGPASLASVFFERLSGWLVLPIVSLIGLALNSGLQDLGTATQIALMLDIAALGALGMLILLAANSHTGRWLAGHDNWLRYFNAVHLGFDAYREDRAGQVKLIATSFAYQGMLVLAAGFSVEAIGIDEVGLTALMAFLPAVLIFQMMPLGIGGLGVREGAFVLFLSELGVSSEEAIALGLLLYLNTLVASLIGLPALTFGGRVREDGNSEPDDIDPALV